MIIFLFMITLLILGASYYCYRIAFHAPNSLRGKRPSTSSEVFSPYRPRMAELFGALVTRRFETVTIRSHDGLTLCARYYHTCDGAPLDICCHGYKSHPYTDFSGGAGLCLEMGHNVLLIEQRGHHRSGGRAITFGIKERYDVLSWVNYSIDRFGEDVKITLYGVSMGASTVLMASGLDLPRQVKGIAADCPYAKPEDIILEVGRKLHYPPQLIRPFIHIGALIFGGFPLNATDAVKSVANAKIPILIIHGEADTYVPCSMSDAIEHANPSLVRRHTFPGAEHAISFLVDEPRYRWLIKEFASKILK